MSITLQHNPANVNFKFIRGDDYKYDFTLCEDDGTPADLTGYKILSVARENANSVKLYELPFVISEPSIGKMTVDFTNTFTAELGQVGRIQEMKYDSQLESPEGFVVTWLNGSIKVEGDYARLGD
jgi:hypothetical protein